MAHYKRNTECEGRTRNRRLKHRVIDKEPVNWEYPGRVAKEADSRKEFKQSKYA